MTGSRGWDDPELEWAMLDVALRLCERTNQRLTLVHGDCPQGADSIAASWARQRELEGRPVTAEPHPAKWRLPDGSKDGLAGFRRNGEMVQRGADYCLTFILRCPCPNRPGPHGTHGSVDCASKAKAAGIPVRHVPPRMARVQA